MTSIGANEIQFAGYWDADIPELAFLEKRGWTEFSVGLFQWVLKSNGKGLKRTKAVFRMKGNVNDYEVVKDRIREIVYVKNNDPMKYENLYGCRKSVWLSPSTLPLLVQLYAAQP